MRIAIEDVTKSFGRMHALDKVKLPIDPGQVIVLLGSNGAGKTTLLNCLGAVYVPTEGRILFDDEPLERTRIDLRRRLMLLPDFPFVQPEATLIDHIGMTLRIWETDLEGMEDKVIGLLEDFDLLPLAETKASSLSRGQLYKTAVVGMIAVDPDLWMLDEPFASGMDPHGLTAFRRHARAAAERGRTVLYTTQILELAEEFSDRVCIIHEGKVHAFDHLDALRSPEHGDGRVLEPILRQLAEETDHGQA
ncbi:MAG: ABC transporter ATP-binding protein [Planctomycetales bacterium]